MKIKFIAVGGTIDKVYFDALDEYQVGQPNCSEILNALPLAFEYEVESLLRKDSLDMNDADRLLVRDHVAAESCERIIITHGTDTMVETAKRLTDIKGKVIILTGAMAPAQFKSSDAVFNIGVAVGAVSSLPEGIYIAMNGRIFDPHRVRKNRQKRMFEEME